MLFFMACENLCIIGAIMLIALIYTGTKKSNEVKGVKQTLIDEH